jgi:hypothetical protein
MHQVLTDSLGGEAALKPRIGGISAANALQGHALRDQVTMMALGSMPRGVAALLPPGLKVVADDPAVQRLADLPTEGESAGHFALLCDATGQSLLLEEWSSVTVDGQQIARDRFERCDILITGSSSVRGFGCLPLERTQALGASHDVAILTGVQYLSDPLEVKSYLEHVAAIHSAGAATALSYTESKQKSAEFSVWGAVKAQGVIDVISLNAGEAYRFLCRLAPSAEAQRQLTLSPEQVTEVQRLAELGARSPSRWENGHEDPAWIAEATLLLQSLLEIPVVRVRGKVADVVVTPCKLSDSHNGQIVRDLMQSRVMAVLKTAHPKGLLTEFRDLAFVRNVPNARALAALFSIADVLQPRASDPSSAAALPVRMYCQLSDGRTLFAIPPLGLYVKDGGTASAGDLMDYVFASQQAKGLLALAHRHKLQSQRLPAPVSGGC